MGEFQIVPIYNPKAILTIWAEVADGFEQVLQMIEDDDLANVLNQLLSGQLLLWVGFKDKKFICFVTTKVIATGTNPPSKYLWIQHGFKRKGIEDDPIGQFMEDMDSFARQMGCSSIRFNSVRKFDRFIRQYGFEPTFTEYKREVSDGWE